MNFGLRIADCGFENRGEQPVMIDFRLRFKSAIRNSKSEIWGGASYRIRTGVSALATPCLEPTGPTMQRNFGLVGEDRIELSPRVPRTRMLALHHTPKDGPKSQVQCPKSVFELLTLDFGRWTSDYPFTQTTCLISATIFTRSLWLRITALMSL